MISQTAPLRKATAATRERLRNSMLPFLLGAIVTAGAFAVIGFLDWKSNVYLFFYRSWYIQAATTWLFATSLCFVLFRFLLLRDESRILDRRVDVWNLRVIDPQRAEELLEAIPSKYREAISFRRFAELLRAYLRGEEIVRLNQELSRRDVEQVETGHLVLNALRQLIPLLGFLGTVVGLSLGMVQFPEISQDVANTERLRTVLKDFAASLSFAFDTTLLALSYSIVVVLLSSVLRHREEVFVSDVDDKARELIKKLTRAGGAGESRQDFVRTISEALRHGSDSVIAKLDELKGVLALRLQAGASGDGEVRRDF